jgi:AcrR family transcriptional regulator
MKKADSKALQKATNLLAQPNESMGVKYSERFFRKLDLWERVFELKSQRMTYAAVARVLNITRGTVYKYYHSYIELKNRVMETRLGDSQLKEITEYLERLEKQREELSWELASMSAQGKNPTVEEQIAKNTTRKLLLDVEKQIAGVKKGLGLWHSVDSDYFTRKKNIELANTLDEKKSRVLELIEKSKNAG